MNIQGHSVKRFDEKRGRKAPVGSFDLYGEISSIFLQATLRRASFPLQRVCHHCVIPQLPKITNPRILSHSLLNSNQAKTANGRSWSARSMGMKSTIRLHCAFSACNYFILPPIESQQSFRSWSSLHPKIPRMQDIFPGRTRSTRPAPFAMYHTAQKRPGTNQSRMFRIRLPFRSHSSGSPLSYTLPLQLYGVPFCHTII